MRTLILFDMEAKAKNMMMIQNSLKCIKLLFLTSIKSLIKMRALILPF